MISKLVYFNQHFSKPSSKKIHLHHYHQFDIVLSGTVKVWTKEDKCFELKKGHSILFPPLTPHGFTSEGFSQATIKFYMEPKYLGASGRQLIISQLGDSQIKIITEACEVFLNDEIWAKEQVNSVISAILLNILRQQIDNKSGIDTTLLADDKHLNTIFQKLIENIYLEPYANWTVEKMAHQASLSTGYFSKKFLSIVKQSPQQFLLELKMREAARDLRSSAPKTIKKLAKLTGYASVHGFTRAFTNVFGQSPAAYRKQNNSL